VAVISISFALASSSAGENPKAQAAEMARKRKELTVEIKPPVQDGIVSTFNNPVVDRRASNVQVLSGKFLGDFQRHYDEKGYKIFDWVLETNPLAYFTALVGLSKIVKVPAGVTHRDGSKMPSLSHATSIALAGTL
jgi:hypothetical protein